MRDGHEQVLASDGAVIGIDVAGAGSPVVIVPGTLAPAALYAPLLAALAPRHRVLLVTRRGYEPGDPGRQPCRAEFQAEDLAGVFALVDEPAVLFGHSFGGVLSLIAPESVREAVRGLVLYEPPLALLGAELTDMRDEVRAAIGRGEPDRAVRAALSISGSPALEAPKLAEAASVRLRSMAPGLLMDLDCASGLTLDPVAEGTKRWSARPILALAGGRSGPRYAAGMRLLRDLAPDVEHRLLPHEPHFPQDLTTIATLITGFAQELAAR